MSLRVERVVTLEALTALATEWDALDEQTGIRVPFTGSLWNRLWFMHFGATHWSVRDVVQTFVVRESNGQLIAIAPMMQTSRPASGPFRIQKTQFMGADPNMTELRRMVCRPEDEARAASAIMRVLVVDSAHWERVEWTGLLDPDAVEWQASPHEVGEPIPMYYVRLPESWDEFRNRLPRNIKESLRKCYNSLKRDGINWSFRIVQSPADMSAAVDCFLALHQSRSKAAFNVVHRNVFASQSSKAFLREYFSAMAAEGKAFAFQLMIDDVVVATRLAMACGSTLYLYYSGFDQAWGKYSVMTTTVAESMKWAIERGFKIANLSTGTDVSKTRWRPESAVFHSRVLQAQTSRVRIMWKLYAGVRRFRNRKSSPVPFLERN